MTRAARIDRVDVNVFTVPTDQPEADGTLTWTETTMVLVTARGGGRDGLGYTYSHAAAAHLIRDKLAPLVMGRSAMDVGGAWQAMRQALRNIGTPGLGSAAIAAVDTALWDLRGRLTGRSVAELLGGAPGAVPVYASSMRRDIQPKDEAERLRRLHAEHGFEAFKIRVGKVTGHDEDEWPGRTEAIIPAVRNAVGDQVILQADANSCYSPAKAIEVGRMMQDHGYFFFEEPCPYWELEWTAEVNQALDMHVAGGEQDNDLAQWRRMIAMDAVEITQPDICYIGGISRAMQVAKMAEAAGKMCVPHSANLSMLTIFALHMMAAIPNAAPHLEYSIEPTPWAEEIYTPLPQVQDGKLILPDGPGWGINIRQDWLEKAEREVSEHA